MSRPLPRFIETRILHDPLEILFAQRQAREDAAIQAVNAGHTPDADPADMRGVPIIARGVGGTSPGSDPFLCVQHWPQR